MSEFRIGRHINISHIFFATPSYAECLGCTIFQIFLMIPQRIMTKSKQKEELIKFGKQLEKKDLKMVIHGSYSINLCHPHKNKKFVSSLKSLVQDLNSSADIGKNCLGVIIHMGKNVPENNITDEEALQNYVEGLKKALKITPKNTTIILETGASQGHEVGSKIDGLAKIYNGLTNMEKERIMFCIDTCHIFATGYDISDKIGVNRYFKEFDDKIGLDKIALMHFNDSKTKLGSGVDRHADLGYGFIKEKGLKAVAQFAKKHNISLVCETPLDSINVKTNREITLEEEFTKLKSWIV